MADDSFAVGRGHSETEGGRSVVAARIKELRIVKNTATLEELIGEA